MERQNKGLIVVVALLAVTVLAMSIGFATLSTTLEINGDVNVKPAKWDIHFDDESFVDNSILAVDNGSVNPNATSKEERATATTATDKLIATTPTISDTSVQWEATLYEIGDKASFDIDIKNEGDYDAVLDSVTLTANPEDPITTNKYLKYTVEVDENTYEIGGTTSAKPELASRDKTTVTVTVEYVKPTDQNLLPDEEVTVSLTAQLVYVPKTTA